MRYTKTHCVNGHKWNDENTAWSTNGNYCKVCRSAGFWRQKRKQRHSNYLLSVWKACADLPPSERA